MDKIIRSRAYLGHWWYLIIKHIARNASVFTFWLKWNLYVRYQNEGRLFRIQCFITEGKFKSKLNSIGSTLANSQEPTWIDHLDWDCSCPAGLTCIAFLLRNSRLRTRCSGWAFKKRHLVAMKTQFCMFLRILYTISVKVLTIWFDTLTM